MSPGKLRAFFVVQGEGRGHLMQALAVAEMLREAGHEVVGAAMGASRMREVPRSLTSPLGVPVLSFPGLILHPGPGRRDVSTLATLGYNAVRAPLYAGAVLRVRAAMRRARPNLVLNFYDPVGGLAALCGGAGSARRVSLGSLHYLLGHEGVEQPASRGGFAGLRVLNGLSAPPGAERGALSLRPLASAPAGTTVFPPLLRREVLRAEPRPGDHLIVYLLNDGYAADIAHWHEAHPDVVIHAFRDRPGAPERVEVRPNLTLHRLSDRLFLELLAGCRGLVTSAGFQVVAEAMWLGKPVMVVPTGNHAEQRWNAAETVASGAGIAMERFDLSAFLDYLPRHPGTPAGYREWVREGPRRFLDFLEDDRG